MARIRSVKPEIRRSLTVAEWPREVRLAWIYLWMYLDDNGRGLDDMRLIVAELFPLDRDVTERKMDKWLQFMATTKTSEDDTPPLCRYEVQGRQYLHATGWQHQKINRPQESRLPPCPIHDAALLDSLNHSRTESVSHSVNGSLPDSPPSRVPADQGSREQGAGNRDRGIRESARGTRIPDDWTPDQPLIDAMRHEGIPDDLARRELPRFRDYWAAQPGAKGRKADWPATWRNWLRRAADDPQGRPPPNGHQPSTADQRVTAGLALAAQLRAEEHPDRQEITG